MVEILKCGHLIKKLLSITFLIFVISKMRKSDIFAEISFN